MADQWPRWIMSAVFAAISMAGTLVLPPMSAGMVAVTTARNPPAPRGPGRSVVS